MPASSGKESQAPFYTVARLTLLPKSEITPAACEAWHIDVTENSTPDTTPLGSINRARWHAEAARRDLKNEPRFPPGRARC